MKLHRDGRWGRCCRPWGVSAWLLFNMIFLFMFTVVVVVVVAVVVAAAVAVVVVVILVVPTYRPAWLSYRFILWIQGVNHRSE